MANQFLLEGVLQAIAAQGSVGAPSTVATAYNAFLCNALPSQIPKATNVEDSAMVGDGVARTMRDTRLYYWDEKTLSIGGLLNDHIAAILMNGFLGGTRTSTVAVAPGNNIATVQKVSNVVPPLYSIYRHLGGEQFVLGDFFVNGFNIAQEAEAQPTFNFDLLSTGIFKDDVALAAASFAEGSIVAVPAYQYFHGAATSFTATDGTDTYDFTNQGTLISLSVEGSNGGRTTKRPGDAFNDPTSNASGAFAKNVAWGKATGMVRVKIDLGSSLPAFKSLALRRTLTGLTIKFVGFEKIGVTVNYYEYEITVPRAKFTMVDGDTDQDYGALSLEITPLRDSVTKGYFKSRILTDKTLF